MRKEREWKNSICIGVFTLFVFVLVSFSGCAAGFLGIGNTASWKEEVLLHDGSKIIVERWQKHGGSHELGQQPGISDQSITFAIPGTNKTVRWNDEASVELGGRSNFYLVALHIFNNVPYIITTPRLCQSYNKWGRPNPPYVIFKYENNEWKRREMTELPTEFKNINLVIETDGYEKELLKQDLVSAQKVSKLNSSLKREEFKTIIRTPIKIWCEEEIYDGTRWYGFNGLDKLPSYEACVDVCNKSGIKAGYCPCKKYFKTDSKGDK